jgi:hypothetical protein
MSLSLVYLLKNPHRALSTFLTSFAYSQCRDPTLIFSNPSYTKLHLFQHQPYQHPKLFSLQNTPFIILGPTSQSKSNMPFTSAIRQAFSSQKSQHQTAGVYSQSPSEQYHRSSQPRSLRPQCVSLPPYEHDVGVYTQSASEIYMRRDSHRHSQPVELPRYQRAVTSTSPQRDFYAPIAEYVPEYYHRESVQDGKHHDGQPPQYQK